MTDATAPSTGSTGSTGSIAAPRVLDADALKGLSHPVRIEIFDILAAYGPHTATGIAERIGESSGVASYHLRQLAKHGLVREIPDRGTVRERWWERTPGAIALHPDGGGSPAVRAATSSLMRHWQGSNAAKLADFVAMAELELPHRWMAASALATVNLRLSVEQLEALGAAWERFVIEHVDPLRGVEAPGARPVQIQFNLFPIIDGVPNPEPAERSDR